MCKNKDQSNTQLTPEEQFNAEKREQRVTLYKLIGTVMKSKKMSRKSLGTTVLANWVSVLV